MMQTVAVCCSQCCDSQINSGVLRNVKRNIAPREAVKQTVCHTCIYGIWLRIMNVISLPIIPQIVFSDHHLVYKIHVMFSSTDRPKIT